MRTARISDLGRGHPRAEFVPKLRVESFHRSDSEGCTIVIIERHSPDRFSTGIYMCAPRARGLAPSRVFLLYRTDNRLPTPPRTAPFWVSAGVLANDSSFDTPNWLASLARTRKHERAIRVLFLLPLLENLASQPAQR